MRLQISQFYTQKGTIWRHYARTVTYKAPTSLKRSAIQDQITLYIRAAKDRWHNLNVKSLNFIHRRRKVVQKKNDKSKISSNNRLS